MALEFKLADFNLMGQVWFYKQCCHTGRILNHDVSSSATIILCVSILHCNRGVCTKAVFQDNMSKDAMGE